MQKISIIIPVKNQKDITQTCLDSLSAYTKDYQLIIIDDGSDKETTSMLLQHIDENDNYIRNDKSVGWCKAINQGLKEVKGDYVLFSNNDVVFTANWIDKMLNHFKRDKELGVLGPVTNKVEGFQHIDYNKKDIDFQYTDVLTFFNVMIKKEVIDKIGGLDERFGLGGQDDADYCIRARKEGFKVGIARDTFIYHYGSASFRDEFNNDIPKSKEFAQSRVDILRNKYKDMVDSGIRKKIFIAIPSSTGQIASSLVQNLIAWTHDPRYVVKLYTPTGLFPLDNARNRTVKEFLETDFDYLWWIDDDIVPPINAMDKLVQADKDAIGAVCYSMKDENGAYFPYPVTLRYNEDKKYIVHYGNGIEEVDATGGACVMVKRKIYEAIERPYEFTYYPDGTLSLTCDFRIWQKIQEKGFKLFIDFSLHCDHIRTCRIKGINDLLVSIGK